MGPGRSLRKLADQYVEQKIYKAYATAVFVLNRWSSKYQWQARLTEAATAQSTAMLEEAANLDADTFIATSRLLNERIRYATRDHADLIVKVRESVRRPVAKGGTSVDVTVNVDVDVRRMAEEIAERTGLNADQLAADVQEYLNAMRVK